MPIVKYDLEMRKKLIEFYAQGYTNKECARLLGVHQQTLSIWKKADNRLNDDMLEARLEEGKGIVERGLRVLAQGLQIEERIEEFVDSSGQDVKKVTVKFKNMPPELKALERLARKYCPEYMTEQKDDNDKTLSLSFNYNSMTFADLIEHRKANNPLDSIPVEFSKADKDS